MKDTAKVTMAILLKIPLYRMLWTFDLSSQGITKSIAILPAKIIKPKNLLVIPKKGIPKVIALSIE